MNIKGLDLQQQQELGEIAKENDIEFIGLFGSYARGEQNEQSDIDLLVKFDFSSKRIGLFGLHKIQTQMEQLLNNKVDIISRPNKFINPYIQKDLITIYER